MTYWNVPAPPLQEAAYMADDSPPQGICSDQIDTIRRALEQLDD